MLVKKSKDGKAPSREKNLLDRSTSRWEDFFHKARSTSAWEKRWPRAQKNRQNIEKQQIECICIILQSVVFCWHFFAYSDPASRRHFRNAATVLQGMARRVAPWQMWRITGRGRAAPRAGAGEPGGPEGTASRPRRVPRLPPGGVDRGAGMAPLLGRPPHATLAHSGGHQRRWSVGPGSRHGLGTDYFRK
jgi:hypothetical protein